jgi:hypothetical protein
MMPPICDTADTCACWLAENGVPVYDLDYSLVKTVASATDLTIDPDNDTAVRSASYTFTSADVGSAVIVDGGEGWPSAGYISGKHQPGQIRSDSRRYHVAGAMAGHHLCPILGGG